MHKIRHRITSKTCLKLVQIWIWWLWVKCKYNLLLTAHNSKFWSDVVCSFKSCCCYTNLCLPCPCGRARPGLNIYQVKNQWIFPNNACFEGISGWGLKAIVKFIEQEQLEIVVMIQLWPNSAKPIASGPAGDGLIRSKNHLFWCDISGKKLQIVLRPIIFYLKCQP